MRTPFKLRRVLRLVAVALFLTVHAVFGPIGYILAALASVIPAPQRWLNRLTRAIIHRAFRVLHFAARLFDLIDFRPSLVGGELPDGPALVVANHPTLLDVTVLMATFPQLSTWVKPSLYERWWIRPMLRCAGFFPSASAFSEVPRVRDDLAARFAAGEKVLVFPEGTRSPADTMLPFGRIAFAAAAESGVPIVPVVIHCEPRWLTKERGFADLPDRPPTFALDVLEPVDPRSAGPSSRALRDVVEAQVRARADVAER